MTFEVEIDRRTLRRILGNVKLWVYGVRIRIIIKFSKPEVAIKKLYNLAATIKNV
jgi:hypothetical protein